MNPNEGLGRRMRFCLICGVGMGILTREEYIKQYIEQDGECPTCGHVAAREIVKEESWVSVMTGHARYNISLSKLWKLTHNNVIRWREGVGGSGKMVPENDLIQFGRRS